MPFTPKQNSLDFLIQTLTMRDPKPPLRMAHLWKADLVKTIESVKSSPGVIAGFHLWNDDKDRCHEIAQKEQMGDLAYWHAILHRREGDFENAKYWYRAVGDSHPVIRQMKERHVKWDAYTFIDHCEKHPGDTVLVDLQAHEMSLLLINCLRFHR